MQGTVFDIKHFSIHDGPGIRSTLFTSGCPLNCIWCQNPEGIEKGGNLWYFENKCIRCNQCIEVCPEDALSVSDGEDGHIIIDRDICTLCGKCTEVCYSQALTFNSKVMSVKEVLKELKKDKIFYETSGGGITISGGEPLYQYNFNLEVLKKCKLEGFHTTLDTCLYAEKKVVERFLNVVDLFLVDLKLFNSYVHKKYTGVPNEVIKENFEMMVENGVEIIVRVPLIPEITVREKNLKYIASYVYQVNKDIPVELINYNPLAENKYNLMEKEFFPKKKYERYSEDKMKYYKNIIQKEGPKVI